MRGQTTRGPLRVSQVDQSRHADAFFKIARAAQWNRIVGSRAGRARLLKSMCGGIVAQIISTTSPQQARDPAIKRRFMRPTLPSSHGHAEHRQVRLSPQLRGHQELREAPRVRRPCRLRPTGQKDQAPDVDDQPPEAAPLDWRLVAGARFFLNYRSLQRRNASTMDLRAARWCTHGDSRSCGRGSETGQQITGIAAPRVRAPPSLRAHAGPSAQGVSRSRKRAATSAISSLYARTARSAVQIGSDWHARNKSQFDHQLK